MKVEFKYPNKIKVKDELTGFTGVIVGRLIMVNGCLQYNIQPPCSMDKESGESSNYIRDAHSFDEVGITPLDSSFTAVPEIVDFKFEVGDRVKSRVNNATGVIMEMVQDANGCQRILVQAPLLNKDGKKEVYHGFEQEYELVDKGLNAATEKPVERKKTGAATRKSW